MKEREIIYNSFDDMIIWSTWSDGCEVICIHGDHVFYYCPGQLLDMVLFTDLLKRMNIGSNDRDNIRNYVGELYDEWKATIKYK